MISPLSPLVPYSPKIQDEAAGNPDPSDLTVPPVVWYDGAATDYKTGAAQDYFTLNGSDVSQWNDRSGFDNHATQITASQQPAKVTGGIGLDGVDECMDMDGTLAKLATNTQGSIFVVFNITDATPSTTNYILSWGDTDEVTFLAPSIPATGKTRLNYRRSSSWRIAKQSTDAVFSDGVDTYCGWIQDAVDPTIRKDGANLALGTFATEAGKTEWFNATALFDNGRIGCLNEANNGDELFFKGVIKEIVAFDYAISGDQLTALETYLAAKWSI